MLPHRSESSGGSGGTSAGRGRAPGDLPDRQVSSRSLFPPKLSTGLPPDWPAATCASRNGIQDLESPAWWALPKSRGAGQRGRRKPSPVLPLRGLESAGWGHKAILIGVHCQAGTFSRGATARGPAGWHHGETEAPQVSALSLAWNVRRGPDRSFRHWKLEGTGARGRALPGCTGGPALIVASRSPHWGPRVVGIAFLGPPVVRTSPGGPPGQSPPRRHVIARHLESFQFLPTLGGNQETGVQVTLRGCRDFPETKKRMDNPPPPRPRREKAHPSFPARS